MRYTNKSISKLVCNLRFWNNLRQVLSQSKCGKPNNFKKTVGTSKPKYQSMIVNIGYGGQCMRLNDRCTFQIKIYLVNLVLKHSCFECPHYLNLRISLFNNLNCNVNSRVLTCGNDRSTYEQNVDIYNYVFEYIRKSNIFLYV